MSCSKASWCTKERIVSYIDTVGARYCVFHAPVGKKGGISKEDFNKKVLEEIAESNNTNCLCDLSDTVFEWEIDFSNIEFKYGAIFSCAHFYEKVFFKKAHFLNSKTRFNDVHFDKMADFSEVHFHDEASFVKAHFSEVLFQAADFHKKVYFKEANFHKEADFSFVHFFSKAYFKSTVFHEEGLLINIDIESVIKFDNATLKDVYFQDTDLRKAEFVNCIFRKHFGRDVLYDEDDLLGKGKNVKSNNHENYKKVEILYRRLKQASIDTHDYDAASDWHYGEKEMQRKGKVVQMRFFGPFYPYLLSTYWLLSGYGEKRIRAFAVLALLVLLLSGASHYAGLCPEDSGRFKIILNTMQYATFQENPILEPINPVGHVVKLLAKILIPGQTALFLLALRNRLRR